ncbi:MAG: Nramp family divalent metal transporter [Planctomycetes bacterium]|nr:Nramp family divalent metal transporter [Planctomycetota bacterium]
MSDATNFDPYALPSDAIQDPPASLWQAFRKIGPGIILAGSIVGSGELIATTTLGAQWGYMFLWLILFSCVIKVFVQIELGRVAISCGKPTLGFLDELPGVRAGVNWQVWWWLFMLLATVAQMGAMVGSVGQALNLAFPEFGAYFVRLFGADSTIGKILTEHPEHPFAVLTAVAAVVLLLSGGYLMIERLTTVLVVGVTAITATCVLCLPFKGYPITLSDLATGFDFHFPTDPADRVKAIGMAFAVFGMTGVGAAELYSYPYWCLEKGYARFVGPRTGDPAWAVRANGWIRVMHLDAWVSMVVFTLATVSFYLLGACVLNKEHLIPAGTNTMKSLAEMYMLVFGNWTFWLFVVGGSAVLFKTLYVASASHSRLVSDFFSMAKFVKYDNAHQRLRMIKILCVFFPLFALTLYLYEPDPVGMVKFGGFAQGITLPVIGCATVYLRYRRTDRRIAPSTLTDVFLWIAAVLLVLFAGKAIWDEAAKRLF